MLFIICLLAVILSIWPDIYRLRQTPPNTTFPLIHNHPEDYFYYLSLMKQGAEGSIKLTSRMTPESFPTALVHTFYAMLGHLSRISGLSLVMVYFFSRILFGALLLGLIFVIAYKIWRSFPLSGQTSYLTLISFLNIAINSGFWNLDFKNNEFIFRQYFSFWTRFNPILRTTYIPHHLLSTFLGLWSIYYLAKVLNKFNLKKLILASFLGLLSGFIYFATMFNILGAVAIYAICLIIKSNLRDKSPRQSISLSLITIFVYIVISSLSLLYLFFLARSGFPWSSYNNVAEKFTFSFIPAEYLFALGPTLILVLIGLPKIIKSSLLLPQLLLTWIAFPFLGILFLKKILPFMGDVYYLEATSYIPIGLLAIFGMVQLKEILLKKHLLLFYYLITILLIYQIIPLYFSLINEQKNTRILYNTYLPNEVIDSFVWLDKNTSHKASILAGGFLGNIIPAFTHNKVFYGHPANTYQADTKLYLAYQIFSGQDAALAKKISQQYGLSYIYYSLDTDLPTQKFLQETNLKLVYQNAKVRIYRF